MEVRKWLIERLMPPTHYLATRHEPEHFLTWLYRGGHASDVREFILKNGQVTELFPSAMRDCCASKRTEGHLGTCDNSLMRSGEMRP